VNHRQFKMRCGVVNWDTAFSASNTMVNATAVKARLGEREGLPQTGVPRSSAALWLRTAAKYKDHHQQRGPRGNRSSFRGERP